jgi:hypothetical protein
MVRLGAGSRPSLVISHAMAPEPTWALEPGSCQRQKDERGILSSPG